MPDPIICIHIGTTTWQGPRSEVPASLRHKLPPEPRQHAIGQEDE